MTLDSEGDPDAVFIFQIGSTLTTASASSVLLIGTGTPCNVFWQVGSSATFGTSTDFVGNVIALASITATTDVTVEGQLLARSGAVTLDTNTITKTVCADETTPTTDPDETTSTTNASSGRPRRSTSTTSTSVALAPATTVPGAESGTGADVDSGTGTETGTAVPASGTPTAGSDSVIGPGGRAGGGGRTGAPGQSTSDGTPTLPTTGMDWGVAIVGALLFLAGVSLLTLSKRRTRPSAA